MRSCLALLSCGLWIVAIPATRAAEVETTSSRIEEVVVTGSRLPRAAATSPSPLKVIGADDFAAAGLTMAADIVRVLPENVGSEFNLDPFTQNLSGGTSNFNLRGLGLNATLVLLNGRRQTISGGVADDGSTFVDMNALVPLIALERMEILKDGSAALYGTDAIAGVANVITRASFQGAEAQLDYANTADSSQDDVTASAILGRGAERWHVMAAAGYLRRSWLPAPDRDYTKGKAFSSFGQPGSFVLLAPSPTFPNLPFGLAQNLPIIDPDCGVVGGIPNPRTQQPAGISGGRVGTCTFDFAPYYHLVPRERRWNAFAEGRVDVSERAAVYAEAGYAWSASMRGTSPSFPILNPPVVPADNPGNVFRTPVLFLGRPLGADAGIGMVKHMSDTWRGVVGARGSIADWSWDVAATHSRNDFLVGIENALRDRFLAALAGRGGPNNNQYFNPFGSASRSRPGDATTNDPRVIADFNSTATYDYRTRLTTLEATLAGEAFDTAAGPWGLAVGGQVRRERVVGDLDEQFNRENYMFFIGGPDFAGTRRATAIFAELRGLVLPTLELQTALRHERYRGGLKSTDPKIALLWTPAAWLAVRASAGTSFRAPSTFQTFSVQTVLEDIVDPLTGTRGFRGVRTLGMPHLKPEQAETYNVGLTLTPREGLSVSADYWRYDYANIIVKQGAQALVDADPRDARIIRAGGQILRIDTGYINASRALTDGLDLEVTQAWSGGGAGDFSAGLNATWIDRYIIQDTPTAPRRNVAGNRNFRTFARSLPEWRATASLGWQRDRHNASAFVRFVDRYRDDQNANRRIASQTTLDLQYGHELPILGDGREVKLTVGALNLFNTDPPDVLTNAGYDSKVHDPRGRVLYVRLKAALP
ncbi:MAG: TonB-dependent receptor [Rhodospirillaceae bacterium]|nr:TonB-dependent receptor [Rhodospirillaceae bacterium]